ncbi:MAG TPA: GIY-YIG nuclease family protein [Bacteroidales bacterium]|nr:GIY-YIG nuclease family protein [Bacteroidales bacterium]
MNSALPIIVYAIKSISHDYIYVGMTNNIVRRIDEHNMGRNRSTKAYIPFELIYSESHSSRENARKREKYFKSGSGKKWLKKLILQQKI